VAQCTFVCLVLASATFATFWPVVGHDFVNLDDTVYVTGNSRVLQGLTWDGTRWAFTNLNAGFWQPLVWLSYMLDVTLFGKGPGGLHFTNLLLHVANTLLLFLFLNRASGVLWRSTLVAALFALHPLHVEPVAWIASRKDVLSTFFGFLSLLCYAHYVEAWREIELRPSRKLLLWYSAAFVMFVCGLMSKTMLVTLPPLMMLLDYWPLQRLTADNWRMRIWCLLAEKGPFLAVAFIFGIVTIYAEKEVGAISPSASSPVAVRIGNGALSYVQYLWQTVWPVNLSPSYPYPKQLAIEAAVGSGLLLLLSSMIVLTQATRRPYLLTGWFWYVGLLLPVSGLIQVGFHSRADRYTYVPLVGIFIALVWGTGELASRLRLPRSIGVVVAGLMVGLCAIVSSKQLRYWSDSVTLFEHTLSVTTSNPITHESLAAALFERGRLAEAIHHHKQAIELRPDFAEAYNNLGDALATQGQRQESIPYFEKALDIKPGYAEAHNNLGTVLTDLGRSSDAVEHYMKALEIKPDYPEAHNNLANLLRSQGKLAAAVEHYQQALKLNPYLAEAHFNLAMTLANQNRPTEAIEHFQHVLEIKSDYAEAHYQLGDMLQQSGRFKAAIAHYQSVLKLAPEHLGARNNLAWLLATCPEESLRSGDMAVEVALQADRISGGKSPEILDTLAASLAEAGRFTEAVATAKQAIELADAQSNTVLAYAIRNRLKLYEARSAYREKH
jgi:tetratricopeptide (TPR) repeat protein